MSICFPLLFDGCGKRKINEYPKAYVYYKSLKPGNKYFCGIDVYQKWILTSIRAELKLGVV